MKMKILPTVILILCCVFSAGARETLPDLRVGMPASEVLTKAGPPASKEVREIKREEVWFYKGYAVVLREGYVARLDGLLGPTPTPEGEATRHHSASRASKTPPPDLLRTILKELPATTPAPGGPGVANVPPGRPNAPPNMMDIEQ